MTDASTFRRRRAAGLRALAVGVLVAASTAACRQDMHDAAKYEPFEKSVFFKDGRASRPLIAGSIARGTLQEDKLLYTGRDGEAFSEKFPFPVTAGVVARGRERFDIYCSPCHSQLGDGKGMIVQRGYKQPASFHDPRLRSSAPGYFFTVMTNGFATMPSYAMQVSPEDRWAITAYIKALQLSRNANVADLTADERQRLERGETEPAAGSDSTGTPGHGHGKEAHGG